MRYVSSAHHDQLYVQSRNVTFRALPQEKSMTSRIIKPVIFVVLCIALATAFFFVSDITSPKKINTNPEVTLQPGIAGATTTTTTSTATTTAKPRPKKYVAITFDDGPSIYTRRILKVLSKYKAHATFFELGQSIKANPSITRAVVAQGSQVAAHSYRHRALTSMTNAQISRDTKRVNTVITRVTKRHNRYVRPPYGSVNKRVRRQLKALGMRTVLWTKDTRDWSRPGVSTIVSRATKNVHNGDVILLHDGGGYRTQTLKALPIILQKLKSQGYTFVTIDQLYKLGLN